MTLPCRSVEATVNSMLAEPTICPLCWGTSPARVCSSRELSMLVGRLEVCSVVAYRCAAGHLFLVPDGVTPLEATASEILL